MRIALVYKSVRVGILTGLRQKCSTFVLHGHITPHYTTLPTLPTMRYSGFSPLPVYVTVYSRNVEDF